MKNNYYLNPMLMLIMNMHKQFGIESRNELPFTDEERKFRVVAMQEELDEYLNSKSKEEDLDAMVDLVVFALGTVERQGMLHVFEEAFGRVMEANCNKVLGENQKRGSFQLDLVKPEGWQAPDHSDLVCNPIEINTKNLSEKLDKVFGPSANISISPNLKTLLRDLKEQNERDYNEELREPLEIRPEDDHLSKPFHPITENNPDQLDLQGIDATLGERGSRYGKFGDNADITQGLINVMESGPNAKKLTLRQREAYHMIFHKIARSVCGDTQYLDNIHDIVGYATLLETHMKNEQGVKYYDDQL